MATSMLGGYDYGYGYSQYQSASSTTTYRPREICEVERELSGHHTRIKLQCPNCSRQQVIAMVIEGRLMSDTYEYLRHKARCDCCGFQFDASEIMHKVERLYHKDQYDYSEKISPYDNTISSGSITNDKIKEEPEDEPKDAFGLLYIHSLTV